MTLKNKEGDTMTQATNISKEAEQINESINIYLEILKAAFKLGLRVFQFVLYLIVTTIEKFLRVIKSLFLNGYEPFKGVVSSKNSILDRIADKNINKYKVKFVAENLSRHEYNFQRTEEFLAQYSYLQKKLQKIADNEIIINTEIYRDIFKRISILIAEAENKALKEGYDYARRSHYQLYDDEIYENFMRDKVLKGESNTDWKELEEKLKNEKSN